MTVNETGKCSNSISPNRASQKMISFSMLHVKKQFRLIFLLLYLLKIKETDTLETILYLIGGRYFYVIFAFKF